MCSATACKMSSCCICNTRWQCNVGQRKRGAAETVPFIPVTNLARTLRFLQEQGLWLIGTDDSVNANLFDMDFTIPSAIVMGAEGKGLRRLTRELCDHLVRIPMAGSVESLNVSVATGVLLFEAIRQRRFI